MDGSWCRFGEGLAFTQTAQAKHYASSRSVINYTDISTFLTYSTSLLGINDMVLANRSAKLNTMALGFFALRKAPIDVRRYDWDALLRKYAGGAADTAVTQPEPRDYVRRTYQVEHAAWCARDPRMGQNIPFACSCLAALRRRTLCSSQ